jgi:hypothetical protein
LPDVSGLLTVLNAPRKSRPMVRLRNRVV